MRRYFDSNDILCVDLRSFDFLRGLTEREFDELERNISLMRLKKGSVVYREGCNVGGMYIVMSGILKVYKTGIEGKEQIIRFAKAGDPIGFRSVMTNEPACTSAEALQEISLCYIPGEQITNLFRSNPVFAHKLMQITCAELDTSNNLILDLAQKTVRERLAKTLLALKDDFDLDSEKRIKIAMTREDLANMVGTATESVIRLLSEFKTDKLIDIQGRYVKLLDIQQLARIAAIKY